MSSARSCSHWRRRPQALKQTAHIGPSEDAVDDAIPLIRLIHVWRSSPFGRLVSPSAGRLQHELVPERVTRWHNTCAILVDQSASAPRSPMGPSGSRVHDAAHVTQTGRYLPVGTTVVVPPACFRGVRRIRIETARRTRRTDGKVATVCVGRGLTCAPGAPPRSERIWLLARNCQGNAVEHGHCRRVSVADKHNVAAECTKGSVQKNGR